MDDVSKALELARNEKIVGKSLDAKVEIFADAETQAFLEGFDELDKLIIVSKAEVKPADKFDGGFEGATVNVKVSAAEGEKCERCWIHSDSVGKSAAHPTLCHRCAQVLEN